MIGCRPPAFESDILRTVLQSINRRFRTIWEKSPHFEGFSIASLQAADSPPYHYKAIVQLRRTFWALIKRLACLDLESRDFSDCFIEDYCVVDFIDDKLYIYKDANHKSVVPLSMPLAFETAAVMVMILLNIE